MNKSTTYAAALLILAASTSSRADLLIYEIESVNAVALGTLGWQLVGDGFMHVGFLAYDASARPLLLALFVCVELNDIAGFCVGKPLVRRKLVPNTSPG